MGFAQTDPGMDIERVEHHRIAPAGAGDLFCRGMRQGVGAPEDESFEGEARVER